MPVEEKTMSWRLILLLSLFGLLISIVTIPLPSPVDWFVWLTLSLSGGWIIAARARSRYFLHGMMTGLGTLLGIALISVSMISPSELHDMIWLIAPARVLMIVGLTIGGVAALAHRVRSRLLQRRRFPIAIDQMTSLFMVGTAVTAASWLLWQIFSPTALLVRYAEKGNLPAVRRLLRLGADPNAYYGRSSAFLVAAREGYVPIMTLLLEQGADPMRCEKEGSAPRLSALSWAAMSGRVDAIEFLVHAGVPLEYECGAGWPTPLEMAAQQGRRAAVAKLIELGADPRRVLDGKNTYLTRAAWSADHTDHPLEMANTIELLIDSGCDVNAPVWDGRTALMMTDVPAVVATLLRKGADPNLTDSKGETALIKVIADAVWKHENPSSSTTYEPEALWLLLEAGADPNHRSLAGDTPLRLASRSGPYRAGIETALRKFGARE